MRSSVGSVAVVSVSLPSIASQPVIASSSAWVETDQSPAHERHSAAESSSSSGLGSVGSQAVAFRQRARATRARARKMGPQGPTDPPAFWQGTSVISVACAVTAYRSDKKRYVNSAEVDPVWFFEDTKAFADRAVYFEKTKAFADLTIAFTTTAAFAKCKKAIPPKK